MNLFDRSSLALIPDGAKDGKLYSIRPTDGSGDFTFERGSDLTATRVDENGLIEKGRENFLLESNNFDEVWTKSSSNVTSGQAGYDGTTDAWSVSKTAQFGRLEQTVILSGLTTMSVYAKASTNDWIAMRHSADGSSIANFDLTNGVFGAIGSNVVATNSVSVGSGWYRVSVTWNYTGSSGVRIHPNASDNIGGTTATIFIQDVQVEQGLVATDYLDTSTGVNKLLYSNNFETGWSGSSHYKTITPDQEGHDGTTNAYLLEKISEGNHYFRQLDVNVDGQATTSIYAKAGTVNYLMIYLNGYIRVNLNNGDVESTGGVFESYNVERIGRNGWWRISLTIASHPSFVYFKPQIGNNVDGTGSIYIQHAQTNEGADTLPYVETQGTTAYSGVLEELPRIDYTGGTQSLLLEPQRTNLIPQSEALDEYSEFKITGSETTKSYTQSVTPEGLNATTQRFLETATTSKHRIYFDNISGLSTGSDYTFSVFVKSIGGRNIKMSDGGKGIEFTISVDLSNGEIQYDEFDNGTVVSYGNGWYRIIASGTNNSGLNLQRVFIGSTDGSAETFLGDTSKGLLLWGVQLEQSSYPTSYIPTYGATATRGSEQSAFELELAPFFNNVGVSGDATFMMETSIVGMSSTHSVDLFSQGGSGNNTYNSTHFGLRIDGGGGVVNFQDLPSILTILDSIKILIRKSGTTFDVFVNGTKSTSTGTIDISATPIKWADHVSTYRNSQAVKQILKFPEALSDKDCKILTGGSYSSFAAMASALNYTVYE